MGRGPLGGVRNHSPNLSTHGEAPPLSDHSSPGLLAALAAFWNPLGSLRVFCFLGAPRDSNACWFSKWVPYTSAASPGRSTDSGLSPRPVFYHTIGAGRGIPELSGGCDPPPLHRPPYPTPAWSALRSRGEECRAGQLWESTQGGSFCFLEERSRCPSVLLEAGRQGRKCPLQGGTGTAKDEFRLGSRRGRRRENSCKEMELLSPEKADRPAYISVSKVSSALQRDLHTQCWGLGSGEVLHGLSKGPGL